MNAPALVGTLDRARYLGGSDAAAYLGVSPWKTPVALYLDKSEGRHEETDPERIKFFKRRKRQEPVVAEMLFDTYGIEVTRLSLDDNPTRYVDPEHDFLAAEIDFEFVMTEAVRAAFPERPDFCAIPDGTLLNGEIKTVHPFKAHEWGEEGSEEVPIHYAAQGMHGLMVTGRPAVLVAALFGLDNLVCFPVMRDEETIAAMRTKAVAFWNDHVLARVPPEPQALEDIKRLFTGTNGKPVELDPQTLEAMQQIDFLRARIRSDEGTLEELQFKVAKFICDQWGLPDPKSAPESDNAVLTYAGQEIATWKRQRGTYLDQKRLAATHPDLVKQFTVEHFYRAIRMKKGKSK